MAADPGGVDPDPTLKKKPVAGSMSRKRNPDPKTMSTTLPITL